MILNSINILTALYPSQAQTPNILTAKFSHIPPQYINTVTRVKKAL